VLGEKKGAVYLLEQIKDKFPRIEKVFADGGYQGKDFHNQVQKDYNLDLELVKRNQTKGFKVLSWRWIVERTFAWFMRYRRLTIDYDGRKRRGLLGLFHSRVEGLTETAEAFIYVAMVRIMLRRLA
jgi:transposase